MDEKLGNLPLRHISIRVPWHDNGWTGTVCKAPELNGSCLRLPRIAENRNDDAEKVIAGKNIFELDEKSWPCCVAERVTFMCPEGYTRHFTHPYSDTSSETHGHFLPTPIWHPPYSAAAVPFKWMFQNRLSELRDEFNLDVDKSREPDLAFKTEWTQDKDNQLAILDYFFDHIKPKRSLCFFYAKEVPFIEDSRRILIGVGLILDVGKAIEYKYSKPGKYRALIWDRVIRHSIRPEKKEGFLLPYYQGLQYEKENPDFNPAEIAAFVQEEYFEEFSYASEQVSHDAAIACLLSCGASFNKAKAKLPGSWDWQIKWIHEHLSKLWKMRGPCPGLGAALCAFGLEYGNFIAHEIENKVGDNEDPWPLIEKIFSNPKEYLTEESATQIGKELQEKWRILPSNRKKLLKLLSRFNIQPNQATILYVPQERERKGVVCTDEEILKNPYLIYEKTRLLEEPLNARIVDRGIFPDSIIRNKHPLPLISSVDSGLDSRRVKAFTINRLEEALDEGHTIQPLNDLILGIRDLPIQPSCNVDEEQMTIVEKTFGDDIVLTQLDDGTPCYQLARLSELGKVIRECINKRRSGIRHNIQENWRGLLDRHLPPLSSIPEEDHFYEEIARKEKTAALRVLAESRFSALVGPAGTGKTTLLSVLCSQKDVALGGVLLLAPTGKARVRMEQIARDKKVNLEGYTIAQWLTRCERYDWNTGRYFLSTAPKESPARTVIVDESSMLTEEMLGALIDSLKGVDRLILIGDPRQLPPIGAGRPFVDIVSELAPENVHSVFPRVGDCYAELTVRRRQTGKVREDIQLAEWFSGLPLEPGEDEVFNRTVYASSSAVVEFKQWETPEQFQNVLKESLTKELGLINEDDLDGFNKSLGAKFVKEYAYFNNDSAESIENWQILSPVKRHTHGVTAINRFIHKKFRSKMIEFAQRTINRKIPKPMGIEQIVYGDKVINVINHPRKYVYPKDEASKYIANGEIGIAVGQFKTKNMKGAPWLLKVTFSSQLGYSYDFSGKDFGDEIEAFIELAYALTIHKAQGSEFGRIILSLPNPCRLISRELIYTALTRQRDRIVILHQGNQSEIFKFTSSEFSETARRLTNLFQKSKPVEFKGKFYEHRLIHKTLRGELVRSKSELTIADCLTRNGIEYSYEQPLNIKEKTKYPDFTIEDDESGKIFYWEHCGMLFDPEYKKRWEQKLIWYKKNGILPFSEGGGPKSTLIVTSDTEKGGISSYDIEQLVKKIFKS